MRKPILLLAALSLAIGYASGATAKPARKPARKSTSTKSSTKSSAKPTAAVPKNAKAPPFAYPEGKELAAAAPAELLKSLPKPSAAFLALARAQKLLGSRKYGDAIAALPKDLPAADADLAAWLAAKAHLGLGQGPAAARRLLWIFENSSESPYARLVPIELGRAELLEAQSLAKAKQYGAAQAVFVRAFNRLSPAGGLAISLTTGDAREFARSCKAKPTLDCEGWLKILDSVTARNGPETAALRKDAPSFPERPDAPSFSYAGPISYREKTSEPDTLDPAVAAFLKGDWDETRKLAGELLTQYPRSASRYRARFLLATAHARDGDDEGAIKEFGSLFKDATLTYYGMLAGWSSKQQAAATIVTDRVSVRTRDPYLTAEELRRLLRAERLLAAKATGLAAQELAKLRPRAQLSGAFLLYVAALQTLAGAHTTAFAVLSELIAREDAATRTRFFLEMIFPRTYFDLVKKAAAREEIDPLLVLSLIKQESAFETEAISRSGAGGLMQLMPATAAEVEQGTARADIYDPETNLRIGIRYLKKMIERFGGNIPLGLSAYNAGPNAVDRWLKDPNGPMKDKQGLDQLEAIPIRETREYAPAIMRNYYWYTFLIEGKILDKLL